ncbi:MAG: GrdX family protein [Gudongella sp.]|nr:GrdX family protein [Gudongella sp.]
MANIIVTNNERVREKFNDSFDIVFVEGLDYLNVLYKVRDLVHLGHELLTHPLSGSVKPNETPFKSVIISGKKGSFDSSGLTILEDSIQTALKFKGNKPMPVWPETILEDFMVIDLSLMENVIEKLGHR